MVSILQGAEGTTATFCFVATVQQCAVASYRFNDGVQVADCVGRDNGN